MIKYDAVVVGAGNSGLISALRLAYAGKKTLLIEQHNLPGGAASSFCRGRFEFEPSLHELCDYGPDDNPGDLHKLFDQLGVKVEWCEVPDCFRVVSTYSDGAPMDVAMPSGRQAFIDKMEEYVPGSRQSMLDFFELAEETLKALGYISAANGAPDSELMQEQYPNFLNTAAYSTVEVFNALKIPPRAQDILATYWSYFAVDLHHFSFMHYALGIIKYVDQKAYIPKYRSHEISMAIIERFRELGGDVWFNTRATEFLFNGDKCCGVKTTAGEVYCEQVLANINPNFIYGKMMPAHLVPEREKRLANARKISARMFVAYFALNKSAEELGIEDYCIFFSNSADTVKAYHSMDTLEDNDYSIMVCYNVTNPEFSPKGTCVVSFTSMFNFDVWGDIKAEDYVQEKNKYAMKMVEAFKKTMGIDISDCIEEMSVASPWSFARYLGTPEGSVYGYETADWDSMMARLMMMKTDYPIKGLKYIGAAGPKGDGYNCAYSTGDIVAKLAISEMQEGGNH